MRLYKSVSKFRDSNNASIIFVATQVLLRQTTRVCRHKHTFVATKDVFCLCREKRRRYLWQLPPMIVTAAAATALMFSARTSQQQQQQQTPCRDNSCRCNQAMTTGEVLHTVIHCHEKPTNQQYEDEASARRYQQRPADAIHQLLRQERLAWTTPAISTQFQERPKTIKTNPPSWEQWNHFQGREELRCSGCTRWNVDKDLFQSLGAEKGTACQRQCHLARRGNCGTQQGWYVPHLRPRPLKNNYQTKPVCSRVDYSAI